MTNKKQIPTILALVITLLAAIIPIPIYAGSEPINLKELLAKAFTSAYSSANVGTVETFGTLSINGELVHQTMTVNSGDYLQTAKSSTATVSIYPSGKVVLGQNTMAYLILGKSSESVQPILVASLLRGSINVELNCEMSAYIESGGRIFTANKGSSFRASNLDGRFEVLGNVSFQNAPQYIVRPVEVGATFSVKARSTRQIQIQVTDEKDRPVPDIPVIFALGSQLGKFGSETTFTATTNSQGIASASFTASQTPGTTSITATVKDTNYSWTGEISVYKGVGFWTTRNKILVTSAAIVAGTVTGVVVATRPSDEKRPVVAQPPIIKTGAANRVGK
jgi:hypothetical protein